MLWLLTRWYRSRRTHCLPLVWLNLRRHRLRSPRNTFQGFQSPPASQASQVPVGQFDTAQNQPNFGDGSELQPNQQENEGELLNVQVPPFHLIKLLIP